ncbi:hypothetical protein OAF33_01230 [bacterium]|nr:hypothetical protein [Verrucomicrobiaceae bacterium]MDB4669645.1 hypothetical protein [bacterium]
MALVSPGKLHTMNPSYHTLTKSHVIAQFLPVHLDHRVTKEGTALIEVTS